MHPSSNRYSGSIETLAGRLFSSRPVLDAEGRHLKRINHRPGGIHVGHREHVCGWAPIIEDVARSASAARHRRWWLMPVMILGAIAGALVLVAVLMAVAWLVLGLNLVRVEGSAMEPTLKRGTYLIIRRAATAPARGEVVAYRLQDPQSTRELMFLHRVIAVEGDTLEVRGGRVRINGTEQEEPYIIEPPK